MSEPPERVTCPNCGKAYRWDAKWIKRQVPCKACGTEFIVPNRPGEGIAVNPEPTASGYELDLAEPETTASSTHYAKPANDGKCPSCNSPLREGAVLCMNCGFNMAQCKKVDAPTVECLPEEDKKAMRRELAGMKWVRIGLWLNMISIVIMFSIVPTTFLAALYDSGLLYLLVGIAGFAFLGFGTLGSILCLTAPKESKGRPILLVSMALSIGTTVWTLMADFGSLSDDPGWIIELISNLATILFLYFFVKLAEYLAFDQITERAQKVLGFYIIITLGSYLLHLPIIGCAALILLLALAIYTLFLYIALLIDLNNALTFHIREQSA